MSAPSLGMRLFVCLGVRLRAPSLRIKLVGWFGSEAVFS